MIQERFDFTKEIRLHHPMLNIAVRAARQAGNVIMRHLDRLDTLNVQTKARNDFVTGAYVHMGAGVREDYGIIPITKWFLEFLGRSLREILIFRLNKTRGLVMLSRGFCD